MSKEERTNKIRQLLGSPMRVLNKDTNNSTTNSDCIKEDTGNKEKSTKPIHKDLEDDLKPVTKSGEFAFQRLKPTSMLAILNMLLALKSCPKLKNGKAVEKSKPAVEKYPADTSYQTNDFSNIREFSEVAASADIAEHFPVASHFEQSTF
jgi:hypothetical protein